MQFFQLSDHLIFRQKKKKKKGNKKKESAEHPGIDNLCIHFMFGARFAAQTR